MSVGPAAKPAFERWRYGVVYVAMAGLILYILWRLIGLQVIERQDWLNQAVENYTANITDSAPRGIIYDRNGYVLARNVASYNVVITPANLPDDEADIQNIYRELSELIGVPTGFPLTDESIEEAKLFGACVEGPGIAQMVALGASLAPYTPVKIKCNVGEEIARITRENSMDWPGVDVEVEPIREYPTGSLTANVIGFLGPIPANLAEEYIARRFIPGRDKVGYAGVELSLDPLLLGTNGLRVIQEDVAGKELRNLEPPIAPVPGYNVVLTIDTRLQSAAEAALTNEIAEWNRYFGTNRISSGVVIAMNPKTGEILAMVTFPTYENNRMSRFIPGYYYEQLSQDPRRPLLNNAISSEFPPGSVFKLSTAVGALNEGVVTLDKIIETPGQLVLTEKFSPNDPGRERPFVDWVYNLNNVINEEGFGTLDYLHCIAFSSNVCFYKLGGGYREEIVQGLGIERLREYARAIGYDQASGIQLPGEQDGLIPTPQWKRINKGENWSTGDTYIASVGQGYVLATPLQVLMSGATVANDGKLMQPTIVREVQDSDGRVVEKWYDPANNGNITDAKSSPTSYQISPFAPTMKWDITVDPLIRVYTCEGPYCTETEDFKTVDPFVVQSVQQGMRLAVVENQGGIRRGTLNRVFGDPIRFPIAVAGKTGTAEYCDDVALAANRCGFGRWPTHSWTLAYAPYEDPEIIIMAFCYNGGEGASVAAPIVALVMQAYFEIKAIDLGVAPGG
jgi:penicillin-binding protein 2